MRYPTRFLASLFVLFLVAGCGNSDDEATNETPVTTATNTTAAPTTTTAAPASGPFRLTFDGEKCTYEGPTELKAGPVLIDFVNETEEAAAGEWRLPVLNVNLMRHTGDETVQDMIDYLGPDPSTRHQPSWVSNPQPAPWDSPVFPGQTVNWEGNLEPGTYTMICALLGPFGVWFGTGLIVED
jgi:hypothetical protein